MDVSPGEDHSRAQLGDTGQHEVGQHLDVVVVFETVLDPAKELEDVQPIHARVQKSVHALEGSLPEVQAVVDLVFERAHLNLTHQLFALLK